MPASQRRQAGSGVAAVNGAGFAYDVAGSGPPLVLLHAGLGDRRMWDDQLPAFAARYTVIRYDARGFGATRKPPVPYAHHADLIALLDHFGVARAHVVGISFASETALAAAMTAPERIASLVLVGSRVGVPVSAELRAGWDRVNELEAAGDVAGTVEHELRMWVDGPDRGPDAVDPAVRERIRAMDAALFARDDLEGEEIPLEPPVAGRLADIAAPTLVVYGGKDVMDVRNAAGPLVAAIPGARLAVIPDAAHLPQMERPRRFNEIVLEFLAGLPFP